MMTSDASEVSTTRQEDFLSLLPLHLTAAWLAVTFTYLIDPLPLPSGRTAVVLSTLAAMLATFVGAQLDALQTDTGAGPSSDVSPQRHRDPRMAAPAPGDRPQRPTPSQPVAPAPWQQPEIGTAESHPIVHLTHERGETQCRQCGGFNPPPRSRRGQTRCRTCGLEQPSERSTRSQGDRPDDLVVVRSWLHHHHKQKEQER